MLQPVAPDLWSAETSLRMPGGFWLPLRMNVARLADGGVAVVSPIRIDDALAAEIAALGEVRYLVAPNLLHHLYLGDAAARWPAARVCAPAALRAKRPDVRIDAALGGEDLPEGLAAAFDAVLVRGAPKMHEVVFFHRPSGTALVTDLAFNVRAPANAASATILWMVGCRGRFAQSRAWRFLTRDRRAAAESARRVLAWPIERVLPAHGEPVAEGARPALERALGWMLAGG